jgi:hypothetical protein
VIAALGSVSLVVMWRCMHLWFRESIPIWSLVRYANRSLRFLDAYCHGLNSRWAAYVMKEYCGHHTLPHNLFDDLRAKRYCSDAD